MEAERSKAVPIITNGAVITKPLPNEPRKLNRPMVNTLFANCIPTRPNSIKNAPRNRTVLLPIFRPSAATAGSATIMPVAPSGATSE